MMPGGGGGGGAAPSHDILADARTPGQSEWAAKGLGEEAVGVEPTGGQAFSEAGWEASGGTAG